MLVSQSLFTFNMKNKISFWMLNVDLLAFACCSEQTVGLTLIINHYVNIITQEHLSFMFTLQHI